MPFHSCVSTLYLLFNVIAPLEQKPVSTSSKNTPSSSGILLHVTVIINITFPLPFAGCDYLDPDILLDLKQQLHHNLDEILEQYRHYVLYIRNSVEAKGISVESLLDHLFYLPGMKYHSDVDKHRLLHGKREKLKEVKTIRALFLLLDEECASFLNYGIFQSIATEYGINEDCEELKYPGHLKAYLKKHTISEFAMVNPRLEKKYSSSKKEVICKFDIELTERVAEVANLQIRIANILGLNARSLELIDVKDGCVVVTFLVPSRIADLIFAENQVFTPQQLEEFEALKIIWLKYGNKLLLDFKNQAFSGTSSLCHA